MRLIDLPKQINKTDFFGEAMVGRKVLELDGRRQWIWSFVLTWADDGRADDARWRRPETALRSVAIECYRRTPLRQGQLKVNLKFCSIKHRVALQSRSHLQVIHSHTHHGIRSQVLRRWQLEDERQQSRDWRNHQLPHCRTPWSQHR